MDGWDIDGGLPSIPTHNQQGCKQVSTTTIDTTALLPNVEAYGRPALFLAVHPVITNRTATISFDCPF